MNHTKYDSQELKETLGSRAKQIIADGLGFKPNSSGKVLCPLHSEKNPSLTWFDEGLMWRCHSCQGKIDIYDFLTGQGKTFPEAVEEVAKMTGTSPAKDPERPKTPVKAPRKEYQLPDIKTEPLGPETVEYMLRRKIKKETLDDWMVEQRTWNGQQVYVFKYFEPGPDLEDKLVYVSYRGIGKGGLKGGCEKNTKPILWGMWHINPDQPVVITEGQPDAMAIWQAGYKNVVSVPNGSNNFQWIENCWEWLQEITAFVVYGDNDEPGHKMAETIKQRLNNVKVITGPHKDANETLYRDGPEKLLKVVLKAVNEKPAGIIDLAEVEYKTAMCGEIETIETGLKEYDKHVEDWKPQELTVIFGRNGEGKTTLVSQIIAHQMEKKVKTFLYSGEMSDQKIQDWLYRQLIGKDKDSYRTIIGKYRNKQEPKPEVLQKIKEWHKNRLLLFDRNVKETMKDLDSFFRIMELAARRYGVKLFIIDNLMAALEENADSLFSDQANFVQRCKDFAIKHNTHVVLLCHPNKEKRELTEEKGNLEKTDISGSLNISNKADNVLAVERIWKEEAAYHAIITSLKDRETGQRKTMKMWYSPENHRFYSLETPENVIYSWRDHQIDLEGFTHVFDDVPWED